MARVYVCDRCGKEIKGRYAGLSYSIRSAVLWIEFDDKDGELELCDACATEFMSWLKGAKKVEP